MKKLFVVVYLLIASANCYANKIDSLTTNNDVEQFLHVVVKKANPNFKDDEKINIITWEKADFNNDGLTDLAVDVKVGHEYRGFNYIVIDNEEGNFQLIGISKAGEADVDEPAEVIKLNGTTAIIFKTVEYTPSRNKEVRNRPTAVHITDTLLYKGFGLVEFNQHPIRPEIDSVIFYAGPCYSACTVFYVKLNKKGKIRFEKDKTCKTHFIKDPWGKAPKISKAKTYLVAKSKLKTSETKTLFELIDYIDFKKLKSQYTVPWTDDMYGRIRVKYKDGSFKEIEDYGQAGTFGLKTLYARLYALAKANKVY